MVGGISWDAKGQESGTWDADYVRGSVVAIRRRGRYDFGFMETIERCQDMGAKAVVRVVCLSVCLSVCLCVCSSVRLCACAPVRLCVCLYPLSVSLCLSPSRIYFERSGPYIPTSTINLS